jgi:tryptophanyl-tRNA synthetase
VPVGDDQVPHLELTREVVRRFNNFYPANLVEPQALLTPTSRLPGLDNRKMSKSYNNTIDLSDDAKTVQNKVRQMYTDPKRIRATDPGTVEGNPVFALHDAFNPDRGEVQDLKERYRAGTVGDIEVKKKLVVTIERFLEPIRERRARYAADPKRIDEIIHAGSARAREEAKRTLHEVREAMHLDYYGL